MLRKYKRTPSILVFTLCLTALMPLQGYAFWSSDEESSEGETKSPQIKSSNQQNSSSYSFDNPQDEEQDTTKSKSFPDLRIDATLFIQKKKYVEAAECWHKLLIHFSSPLYLSKESIAYMASDFQWGARSYFGERDYESAEKCWNVLLHSAQRGLYTLTSDDYRGIAETYSKLKNHEEAIRYWEKIISNSPTFEDYIDASRANLLAKTQATNVRAVQLINIALALFEGKENINRLRSWDQKYQEYTKQLRNTRIEALVVYFYTKNWEDLIHLWEKMNASSKELTGYPSDICRMVARAYYKLKKYDDAVRLSEKALEDDERLLNDCTYGSGYRLRLKNIKTTAYLNRLAGNHQKAAGFWDLFYTMNRDQTSKEKLDNFRESGQAYFENKNYKKAGQQWLKASDLESEDSWTDLFKGIEAYFLSKNSDCYSDAVDLCHRVMNEDFRYKTEYVLEEGTYVEKKIERKGFDSTLQTRAKSLLETYAPSRKEDSLSADPSSSFKTDPVEKKDSSNALKLLQKFKKKGPSQKK